ncbi:hypothetical protein [Streptomyces sp. 404i]|nr:hypothetical protein [Streptomyces sp. 404i]MBQ1106921.1 hypothetical protein [Streptomyces sp. 404i]
MRRRHLPLSSTVRCGQPEEQSSRTALRKQKGLRGALRQLLGKKYEQR